MMPRSVRRARWCRSSSLGPTLRPSRPGPSKGPAFFAYANNYLIDVKVGIIVDVEATRALRQGEVEAAKTMIDRTEERFGLRPERLVGDTAYGAGANLDCSDRAHPVLIPRPSSLRCFGGVSDLR